MQSSTLNTDPAELAKFSELASQWWDPNGKFRPLHDINPLRLALIDTTVGGLKGTHTIDIGCGGGLVSEGMAKMGARVVGVDMAGKALSVAKLHALESGVEIDYREATAEQMADEMPGAFDVVSCLEMLEHVPDPKSVIAACAKLAKPGGHLFFSTISRTPKAYLFAVLGAEYVMNLLPKGTHDYAKFLKPSALIGFAEHSGLSLTDLRGMDYNPFTHIAKWQQNTNVNYIVSCRK